MARLHEYQGKAILAANGFKIPRGRAAEESRTEIPRSKYKGERKPTMKEEKILTRHPLGKSGKNIDKQKYNAVKAAILSALAKKELTHTDLFTQLNKGLKGKFTGNISWYRETVKLDLEARR